jgi:hypothetical protein
MNRAPTWVRPAANEMPLCRDAVPSLPARGATRGARGHGDKGAWGSGSRKESLPARTVMKPRHILSGESHQSCLLPALD